MRLVHYVLNENGSYDPKIYENVIDFSSEIFTGNLIVSYIDGFENKRIILPIGSWFTITN